MTDKTLSAAEQRARSNRRLTLLLLLIAAGVYVVFIASSMLHSRS